MIGDITKDIALPRRGKKKLSKTAVGTSRKKILSVKNVIFLALKYPEQN